MDAEKMTDEELEKEGLIALERLEEIEKCADWEKTGDKPCLMFKMGVDNRLASRGEAIVEFPMDQVYEFLGEEVTLYKLNPQLKEIKALHEVKDSFRVNYMQYHGIWPVANRDFVNVGKKVKREERCVIAAKQCQYPYPLEKKVVRGICHIGGYILEKVGEKSTRVIYISDVDVMGSIPALVKKQLSKRQGEIASRIESEMKKL